MTVTPETANTPAERHGGDYDVVIIGAGISGIGAAYRLGRAQTRPPATSSWSAATASAAPGTCSAIPACARTPPSSP